MALLGGIVEATPGGKNQFLVLEFFYGLVNLFFVKAGFFCNLSAL